MWRAILAGVAALALCGPARACDFSAADFRSLFDRTIAPRAGLEAVSEYNCQEENGAAFCNMVTPSTLAFLVEDAPKVRRTALLVMTFDRPPPKAALDVVYRALAGLCSPEVDEATREAALSRAAAAPAAWPDGSRVIIGDVSYRFLGPGALRLKDRRLPNLMGVNTSDDE